MPDDPVPTPTGRLARRQVLQMLTGTAIAGALPAVAAGHPVLGHLANEAALARGQAKAAAPDWKPAFLDQHQFETLESLAELVVPGAARARTSQFVDELLAVDAQSDQRQFLSALGAFDALARARGGRPWKQLPAEVQAGILTEASTMSPGTEPARPWTRGEPILPPAQSTASRTTLRDHFDLLKGWIAGAYYSSEIGMKELGWTGHAFFESFPGCTHPDGHA